MLGPSLRMQKNWEYPPPPPPGDLSIMNLDGPLMPSIAFQVSPTYNSGGDDGMWKRRKTDDRRRAIAQLRVNWAIYGYNKV